eukprot:gene30728-35764_t
MILMAVYSGFECLLGLELFNALLSGMPLLLLLCVGLWLMLASGMTGASSSGGFVRRGLLVLVRLLLRGPEVMFVRRSRRCMLFLGEASLHWPPCLLLRLRLVFCACPWLSRSFWFLLSTRARALFSCFLLWPLPCVFLAPAYFLLRRWVLFLFCPSPAGPLSRAAAGPAVPAGWFCGRLALAASFAAAAAASRRLGLNAAAGPRGFCRPRPRPDAGLVSVGVGVACMSLAALMLMLYRQELGGFFTSDEDVKRLTAQAVPSIALSLVGEGANTVLAGVLRGCGRQRIGATVNLGLYWGLGLPFAYFLAFKMGLEAMGLWTGLACTASLQSLYLACVVFRFDWGVEALRAKALIAAGEVDFDVDEELLAEVEGDQDRE